jgi:hypothetical protein
MVANVVERAREIVELLERGGGDARLANIVIGAPPDSIANIVIGCLPGTGRAGRIDGPPRQLATFHHPGPLGRRIVRNDWIKIARDRRTRPELAFGGRLR